MTMIPENFADLLTPVYRDISFNQYKRVEERESMLKELFNMQDSKKSSEQLSSIGSFGDFEEFTGTVPYSDLNQGYDKEFTHTEYVAGLKTRRSLLADDLYGKIKQAPVAMGVSAMRKREQDGAKIFNNAFTDEPSDGDAAELCASDHPSAAQGVSKSESNEGTTAISATAIATTKRLMEEFTDDQLKMIGVSPDTIVVPNSTTGDKAMEINGSEKQLDTANNNINIHQGKYKIIRWKYLTDTNNWFMVDSAYMKMMLHWFNREPYQIFKDKNSDQLEAKHIGYMRYSLGWSDYVWIYGNKVA